MPVKMFHIVLHFSIISKLEEVFRSGIQIALCPISHHSRLIMTLCKFIRNLGVVQETVNLGYQSAVCDFSIFCGYLLNIVTLTGEQATDAADAPCLFFRVNFL